MTTETEYWQQQYKEGKIPQEWLDECCGETRALLEMKCDPFPIVRMAIAIAGIMLVIFVICALHWR